MLYVLVGPDGKVWEFTARVSYTACLNEIGLEIRDYMWPEEFKGEMVKAIEAAGWRVRKCHLELDG